MSVPASTLEQTPPTGTPAAVPTPPADPAPAAAAPVPPALATPPAASPWDDPAAAKAEIERLRRENASERTNAKAKAAEDARNELAQTIGKALGLVKDEPVDPAKLTEQLTATQAQAKQAALELAIFRSTPAAAAAAALLDSRSFLAKIADVDPTDTATITAAVEAWASENPARGPRLPAPTPGQGAAAAGSTAVSQLSEADLTNMTPEQIVAAKNEGRLNNLLGVR